MQKVNYKLFPKKHKRKLSTGIRVGENSFYPYRTHYSPYLTEYNGVYVENHFGLGFNDEDMLDDTRNKVELQQDLEDKRKKTEKTFYWSIGSQQNEVVLQSDGRITAVSCDYEGGCGGYLENNYTLALGMIDRASQDYPEIYTEILRHIEPDIEEPHYRELLEYCKRKVENNYLKYKRDYDNLVLEPKKNLVRKKELK